MVPIQSIQHVRTLKHQLRCVYATGSRCFLQLWIMRWALFTARALPGVSDTVVSSQTQLVHGDVTVQLLVGQTFSKAEHNDHKKKQATDHDWNTNWCPGSVRNLQHQHYSSGINKPICSGGLSQCPATSLFVIVKKQVQSLTRPLNTFGKFRGIFTEMTMTLITHDGSACLR